MIENTLQYRTVTGLVWRLRHGTRADAFVKAIDAMTQELANHGLPADIFIEADAEFVVLTAQVEATEQDAMPTRDGARSSTMGGAPPVYTSNGRAADIHPSITDAPPYAPTDLRPGANVLHGEIAEGP